MRTLRTRRRTLKVCKPSTTEQNTETIFPSWDPCDRCPRRPMALTLDALGIVAVASAIGWWAVGIVSAVRSRVAVERRRDPGAAGGADADGPPSDRRSDRKGAGGAQPKGHGTARPTDAPGPRRENGFGDWFRR